MKKNYILLFVLFMHMFAVQATTIYAYRSFQRDAGSTASVRGPVKFDTSNPRAISLIADQSKMGICYAGTYYNYKWYAQVTQAGTQSTVDGLYTIDMETGQRSLIASSGLQLTDMTYDYSTNTMYGIRNGAQKLATINLATGEVTEIASFHDNAGSNNVYMLALAADLNGEMYGIASNDTLYRIEKSTAKCTRIGALMVNAAFTQSMCFDYRNHVLYWVNNGDYGFYTVDTTTGKATLIGALGETGYDSLNSLFVPFINVAEGAPDRVVNRSFTTSGNDVKLVWTNPTIDAQGNDLTDLTAVKVYRDSMLVATVSLNASMKGKESSYTDKQVSTGLHRYRLISSNSKGDGGYDSDDMVVAVGANAPGPVENLKVTTGDNTATLVWSKPTKGIYGGEYDPNSVTKYTVTRISGKNSTQFETTATSFTDTLSFGRYSYTIVAYNQVGKGAETSTGQVLVKPDNWIVMGTTTAIVEPGKTYSFYDYGGEEYYPNNENDTLTIKPSQPGYYINVKFTELSLDTYGDTLKIYNGSSVAAPLIGKFSAQSLPAVLANIDAENAEGALTFVFTSDVMSRDKGWKASVEAVKKRQHDLVARSLRATLYPNVNDTVTYTIGIINKGINTASGYTVQLIDSDGKVLASANGPKLETMQSAEVELQYLPKLAGKMIVKGKIAFDQDEDASNNTTEPVEQTVVPEGSKYITITSTPAKAISVVPASFYSNETLTETIYPASHFGQASGLELTMIAYPYNKVTTSYPEVPLQVYVGESEIVDLSDGAIPASNLVKVFDGNVSINTTDDALVIPFQNNYPYGGKNLVVMVYKNAPSTNNSGVSFNGTYGNSSTDPKYTRFDSKWTGDDTHFDLNENFGYSAQTQRADINCLFVAKQLTNTTTINASHCSAKGLDGAIEVSSPAGCNLAIYRVDGSLVASFKLTANTTIIPSTPGFFVVRVGQQAFKVLVR